MVAESRVFLRFVVPLLLAAALLSCGEGRPGSVRLLLDGGLPSHLGVSKKV